MQTAKLSKYNLYIKELKNLCQVEHWPMKIIGKVDQYIFYKIIIQPKKAYGRIICFSAGIHGDEISGPLAIKDLLVGLNKELIGNNKIVFLPIGNPYGFDKNQRTNYRKINLNRHFCDCQLPDECKILFSAVKQDKPDYFISLHEDDEQQCFYFYAMDKQTSDQKLHQKIKLAAKKHLKICRQNFLYKHLVNHGVVFDVKDGSFEDRMNREGVKESLCLEIPDYLDLKKRIALAVSIMREIIRYKKT